MKKLALLPVTLFALSSLTALFSPVPRSAEAPTGKDALYRVQKTEDFEITGDGSSTQWERAEWIELVPRPSDSSTEVMDTRARALWSDTGVYFLFHNQDRKLTATMDEDMMEIWREDVVEVFLWPDESRPVYFEYELSPLNVELALLVDNRDGDLNSWIPFSHTYHGDRLTRRKTTVTGGAAESGGGITGWTAEFFIPYELMRPLNGVPPRSGSTWRANLYRIDYDDEQSRAFFWQPVEGSFHQYENYGTFQFD